MRRPIVYIAGGFAGGLAAAGQTALSWKVWALAAVSLAAAAVLLGAAARHGGAAHAGYDGAAGEGPGVTAETLRAGQAPARSPGQIRQAALYAALLILTAAAGGLYYTLQDSAPGSLTGLVGQDCRLEGYVLSAKPAASEQQSDRLLVKTGDETIMVSLKETLPALRELPGRKISFSGLLERPAGPVNPGMFDYGLYLKSIGIRTVMRADSVEVLDAPVKRLTNAIACFKARFWLVLSGSMKKEAAGILFGMLFGDKTYMGQEVYEDFQKNGTAHILSVSGIHVGILYACMEKTLGRGRRRSIPYNATVVLLLFLYAALSEFTPSVMRAAFMIIVYIASKLLLRPYDFTACTAFTAFVLLLKNPFYIHNTGFILSYSAVCVLAVLLPAAQRALDKKVREKEGLIPYRKKPAAVKAAELFLPVVIIQLGLAPLTAYFFNYFSLAAFFINVPVIFMAGFLLPLGLLLMGVCLLAEPGLFVFRFLAFVTDYPIRLMTFLNHLTAKEGAGFFNAPSPSLKWVALYYMIIFFLSCELGQTLSLSRTRRKYMGAVLAVVLAAVLVMPSGKLAADIVLIDVGQGDGIHIRTPEGKNILIDGGGSVMKERDVGKAILYPYFMKNGVGVIDLAIVTHMHEDHYEGLSSLAGLMPVKKAAVFAGYQDKEDWLEKKLNIAAENIMYVTGGQTIQLGREVSIQILYPGWPQDGMAEDENENSLVLRVNYGGVSLLSTGDLLANGERRLLERYAGGSQAQPADAVAGLLACDILKAGHHGAKTSNTQAFLEAASPGAVVIQVGRRNSFGHPSPEVTERLSALGILVYRNDEQGAVLINAGRSTGKKRLKILEMKEQMWHNY